MTKEEILHELEKTEWNDTFKENLERMIAKYVVYQEDPDTHSRYCEEYFMHRKEAIEDYNARKYVPCGMWCYCKLDLLQEDRMSKTELKREISIEFIYD